jgi:hypothetical protein
MGLRADLVEFGGVSGDACVSARPSSYRPKVTVHAGYAVQIRRPKSTPHIHGSELGHSADCRQDNRRQKLNCIGCLGGCSFYEANLRFIPEDMTSEGVRILSTEFQIFISSTVEDLKPVRKKLLCALEQPGRPPADGAARRVSIGRASRIFLAPSTRSHFSFRCIRTSMLPAWLKRVRLRMAIWRTA